MNNLHEIKRLEDIAFLIRKELVKLASQVTIHIGGDLSAVDILTVLWQNVMQYDIHNSKWEYRDRFILSKGHCSAAVAFNQAQLGCYDVSDIFEEYATDNCRFSMSPCRHTNQFYESSATGSLGQGLPIAVGMAAALKAKKNTKSKVYVLLGDGELQEGSNWEAVMYASQICLDNIVAIIDNNGLQFDGETKNINHIDDAGKRFAAFGWDTYSIDGHKIDQLLCVFEKIKKQKSPVLIEAHTVKGKGVNFMENNYLWHAGKITEKQLDEAISSIHKMYGERIKNV
ncbi:MAG: transketolase [Lachnospiraceae bacterium]|nr:transketolase [Lachnospiraceae bacterium]